MGRWDGGDEGGGRGGRRQGQGSGVPRGTAFGPQSNQSEEVGGGRVEGKGGGEGRSWESKGQSEPSPRGEDKYETSYLKYLQTIEIFSFLKYGSKVRQLRMFEVRSYEAEKTLKMILATFKKIDV
jgi:hypothetical protein